MFSAFNQTNRILQLACDNDPEAPRRLNHLLLTSKGEAAVQVHATEAIINFFKEPQKFKFPDQMISGLFEHVFSPSAFFKKYGDHIKPPTLWGVCCQDMRPETAKAAAFFVAEGIRCRELAKDHFSFDIDKLFKDKAVSAKAAFDDQSFKASFLLVQNALVDLVEEASHSTSLTSGASILALMRDENLQAQFWAKKLHDVKIRNVMSLKEGDKTVYQMVFEP